MKGNFVNDTSTDALDRFGSVNHTVVVFDRAQVPDEGFRALLALVDGGTIRILDAEFVTLVDGAPTVVDAAELGQELQDFVGACSGLLDHTDLEAVAASLAPGQFAAVVVYELLAMLPVIRLWENAGAIVVEGAVDIADLDDALTAVEAAV